MTACLNRLEQRGLIRRSPDAADRRSLMATLTAEGMQLIDDAIAAHFAEADRMIAGLAPTGTPASTAGSGT